MLLIPPDETNNETKMTSCVFLFYQPAGSIKRTRPKRCANLVVAFFEVRRSRFQFGISLLWQGTPHLWSKRFGKFVHNPRW